MSNRPPRQPVGDKIELAKRKFCRTSSGLANPVTADRIETSASLRAHRQARAGSRTANSAPAPRPPRERRLSETSVAMISGESAPARRVRARLKSIAQRQRFLAERAGPPTRIRRAPGRVSSGPNRISRLADHVEHFRHRERRNFSWLSNASTTKIAELRNAHHVTDQIVERVEPALAHQRLQRGFRSAIRDLPQICWPVARFQQRGEDVERAHWAGSPGRASTSRFSGPAAINLADLGGQHDSQRRWPAGRDGPRACPRQLNWPGPAQRRTRPEIDDSVAPPWLPSRPIPAQHDREARRAAHKTGQRCRTSDRPMACSRSSLVRVESRNRRSVAGPDDSQMRVRPARRSTRPRPNPQTISRGRHKGGPASTANLPPRNRA